MNCQSCIYEVIYFQHSLTKLNFRPTYQFRKKITKYDANKLFENRFGISRSKLTWVSVVKKITLGHLFLSLTFKKLKFVFFIPRIYCRTILGIVHLDFREKLSHVSQ